LPTESRQSEIESDRLPAGGEGRGIGLLVHQALERVALAGRGSLDAILDAEGRELGLSAEACAEARRLVDVAIGSDLWRRAHAGSDCYHEVPFSVEVRGAVLAGSMDMLYMEEGEAVIVDFKTDAVRGAAGVEGRAAVYRSQVLAYALAAQRILCKPVREVILFFLTDGREWRLPITDELLREAELLVAAPPESGGAVS
jgi:ATP-dependent helicase/nuclease subunit A